MKNEKPVERHSSSTNQRFNGSTTKKRATRNLIRCNPFLLYLVISVAGHFFIFQFRIGLRRNRMGRHPAFLFTQ